MRIHSTHRSIVTARHAALLLFAGVAILLSGCAGSKPEEKPVHQRGWVGGEYKKVASLPEALRHERKSAILVTALSTNSPVRLAGLREGDLLFELNHEPVRRLKDLRRIVDASEPGSALPVKVYRDGEMLELHLVVGQEKFRHRGNLMLGFGLSSPDLWPNPDFSLIVVSYYRGRDRAELGSVENTYRHNLHPKNFQAVNSEWRFWLVIMGVSREKIILAQEAVPAR